MQKYLELLRKVKETGVEKGDRTGTGTRSLFGEQLRFDLLDGLPLLTTKKLPTKAIIVELLWFLRGETNVQFLHDHGVHIWDNWLRPWPSDRPLVLVEPRPREYQPYDGDFSAAGCYGEESSVERSLVGIWTRMMRRCYDPQAHNYAYYGGAGASVAGRWHDPRNFIRDAQSLPHWRYKLNDWDNFELDKDYYGSNQYGPDTCIWLPGTENRRKAGVVITDPEGESTVYETYKDASEGTGFSKSSIHRFVTEGLPEILKGKNKAAAGWSFALSEDLTGMLVRRELVDDKDLGPVYGKQWRSWPAPDGSTVDQIARVTKQIREKPDSRRHVVTAWNPAEVDEMALPPCHCLFQFYVANGRLSCQLYQRSADLFIGVPFNMASYAILTALMAYMTNHKPGEFIHTFGDVHLYLNHFEQAEEQLARSPATTWPQLHVSQDCSTRRFEDLEPCDFRITNYDPNPAIKAPVAV